MRVNHGLFSSASVHWATPKDLYDALNTEFNFNDDPCPLEPMTDGLARRWGSSTYCNPPYGKEIGIWLKKAYEESLQGGVVVCLIPSRTDTQWWNMYCKSAQVIVFIKGRLRFNGAKCSAPFPSALIIYTQKECDINTLQSLGHVVLSVDYVQRHGLPCGTYSLSLGGSNVHAV